MFTKGVNVIGHKNQKALSLINCIKNKDNMFSGIVKMSLQQSQASLSVMYVYM